MENKNQKIFTHQGLSEQEYFEMIRYFEDPRRNKDRMGINIPNIEEYDLIGDAGNNFMYGHLPKRFVRFPASEFGEFLKEIQKDNCSYVSYLDHQDVKNSGKFYGEYLSVLLKKMGSFIDLNSDDFSHEEIMRWTSFNDETKRLVASEIIGSRLFNYFGVKTVYNKALLQDYVVYLLSIDFIKPEQNFYPMGLFQSNREMDSYMNIKGNIETFNRKIDDMLRIFRNEGNKTVVVDRNELIKEYVKSYLLRVLVFKDSDFKAENVGLIHDKEKNKIFYGPNFDYEYLFRKITHVSGMSKKHHENIEYIYLNYPEIVEEFSQKLQELIKINYKKPISDLDVILINEFDIDLADKCKFVITENVNEFLESLENVKIKYQTNG